MDPRIKLAVSQELAATMEVAVPYCFRPGADVGVSGRAKFREHLHTLARSFNEGKAAETEVLAAAAAGVAFAKATKAAKNLNQECGNLHSAAHKLLEKCALAMRIGLDERFTAEQIARGTSYFTGCSILRQQQVLQKI